MVNMPWKGGNFNDTCSNTLCCEERGGSVNTDGLSGCVRIYVCGF